MSLMMFDFHCTLCDKSFERLVESDIRRQPCPQCTALAKRVISPVRLDWRMGVDTDMPTMADKWERIHRQAAKQESKD